MTKVVNIKHSKCDVFIGRPSPWGNPFQIGIHGDRKQVIQQFLDWASENPNIINHLEELRGKRLGCYCKPQFCHGDVYLYLLGESSEVINYLNDDTL